MRNIVIPFRNTNGTDELKMCIKLIKKNLYLFYNTIYILGDECEFDDLDIENIVIKEQKYNKWLDSNFLVLYYIENINHKDEFILFNDDFFLTSKVEEIPIYSFDTLSNRVLTTYVINSRVNQIRPSAYGLNILKFIQDFGDFKNYEVHIPMVISCPDMMAEAIKLCQEHDCPALKRTMYVWLGRFSDTQELKNDVKFGEPLKIMQFPFFSLTDTEFDVFKKDLEKIANEEEILSL